jgi:hypothetical protein
VSFDTRVEPKRNLYLLFDNMWNGVGYFESTEIYLALLLMGG